MNAVHPSRRTPHRPFEPSDRPNLRGRPRFSAYLTIPLLAILTLLLGAFAVAPRLAEVARAQQGLPVKVYPQPGEQGVWPGSSITLSFDREVLTSSVEAALTMTPDLPHRKVWRGNTQLEIRPDEPMSQEAVQRLRLGSSAMDARGRPLLDKDYEWSFTTGRYQTQLSFGWGLPVQLLAPSGKNGVGVQPGYPRATLDFALYPIDLKGFAGRYALLENGDQNKIDVKDLTASARWRRHVDNSDGMSGIRPPEGTLPGLYVVEASHPDLGVAHALLIYSDHALVAKRGRNGLTGWLTRWLEAQPEAGGRVMALDAEGNLLGEAASNAEGLVDLGALAENAAFLAAEIEGQTTLVGLDAQWTSSGYYWWWWGGGWEQGVPQLSAHLHTDRPIYRPGHTVHYKATIRRFTGEAQALAVLEATAPVSVTIRDAKGNVIQRDTPAVDEFGSVTGDLVLADEVAMGQWSVEVRAGDQTFNSSFQVQDYVKPDFEVQILPDADYYVRGDEAGISVQADYYFGQPASGADVVLRAYRGYWWRGEGGVAVAQAEGKTGPDGSFTGRLTLDGSETYAETYTLEAEVVDASRRPVYGTAYVTVHPADFALTLENPRYGIETGEPVQLIARTMGHDGQPQAGRQVAVALQQYRRDGTFEIARENVTTGADGTALVDFGPRPEGWFSVQATAADDAGRRVLANSYAWVYNGAQPWYWWGGLEMQADREQYAPGDTANILIKSPITTTALITIERDEVYEERVVEVAGATTIALPIEAEYAPNVTVKVQMWQKDAGGYGKESRIVAASVDLIVPATDQRLSVEVLPDASEHGPGEDVTFTLRVRDAAGQPVDAQLSFALVDKAVLALASDRSGDIFDAFWNRWQNAVRSYDSAVPGQTFDDRQVDAGGPGRGGGASPEPGPPSQENKDDDSGQATPRSEFRDTAWWEASLRTGPDGEVSLTLPLPDNLTTWQALARAVTREGPVGQGSAELLVTKPIIAQPALPRFAVQGDEFILDVLGRNFALPGVLGASCTLETPGLVQLDPGERTLQLPMGETKVARWSVVASQLGTNLVSARVDTTAGSDAIELPLDVQPFSVPDRFVISGSTEDAAAESFEVPYKTVPDASSVTLRLAPSLAFGVLEGVESLIGYPYGCVEQTMGKVLPNAVVGRLAKHIPLDAPEITEDLPEYMAAGLQKLYGFQNSDGSWGWWYGDGNLYTTAYVMQGLLLVEEAGYAVDPQVIARGLAWLGANIGQPGAVEGPRVPEQGKEEADLRLQAYAAYVLGQAGQPVEAQLLDRLYDGRAGLDAFALSSLALVLNVAGDTTRSNQVLGDLVARAETTATDAWWPMETPPDGRWNYYYWRSMASSEKNTAMALSTLSTLDPESTLAPKAARWLLAHRWGTGWRTTHDTAFAVLALTDFLLSSGDLEAEYDWSVSLDGREMATGRVDSSNVTKPLPPVVIPGTELSPGPHVLGFSKTGRGTLYYTAIGDLALFHEGFAATEAAGMGLTLKREYQPIVGRSGADGWHVGDLINVRLTLQTRDELHYMIIEDLLPAGFEGLNQSLETETTRIPGGAMPWWRWWGYERHEVRDDRVSFFSSYIPAGEYTFEYAARAVTPGRFGARPAEAYAMYRPEVWGRSATDQISIDPDRLVRRPDLKGDFDRDCRLTEFDASLVADGWSGGPGADRDLTGEGRVSVADIALAGSRAGLLCGDAAPALPAPAGEASLSLVAPALVRQGQSFALEIRLQAAGKVGAWEATLKLPKGFSAVGLELDPSSLPGQLSLGPTLDAKAGTLKIGGWTREGGKALTEPTTLARLMILPASDGEADIAVVSAEAVTEAGGAYTLKSDGVVVSPEPWTPAGRLFLPSLWQR